MRPAVFEGGVGFIRGDGFIRGGVGDVIGRIVTGVGVAPGVCAGVGVASKSSSGDVVGDGDGVAVGFGVGVGVRKLALASEFVFEFVLKLLLVLKLKLLSIPRLVFKLRFSEFVFVTTFEFDEPPFESIQKPAAPIARTAIVPMIVNITTFTVFDSCGRW